MDYSTFEFGFVVTNLKTFFISISFMISRTQLHCGHEMPTSNAVGLSSIAIAGLQTVAVENTGDLLVAGN